MVRKLVLHCRTIDAPGSGTAPGGNDIALHFATLEALEPRLHELEALLDGHERDRAARFVHDRDRMRYVLGHGFMREVLSRVTGIPGDQIEFMRGPFGKPIMNGTDLHFNFSDTKDAVLIGIGPEELGVDLETMDRRVDHERVAEHYFTPEEVKEIQGSAVNVDQKRMFLDFWTRKEAVLKASGVGIMDDLKVLRVQDGSHAIDIAHEEFIRMAAAQYHISTFALGATHIASIALPQVRSVYLTPPRRTGDGN